MLLINLVNISRFKKQNKNNTYLYQLGTQQKLLLSSLFLYYFQLLHKRNTVFKVAIRSNKDKANQEIQYKKKNKINY